MGVGERRRSGSGGWREKEEWEWGLEREGGVGAMQDGEMDLVRLHESVKCLYSGRNIKIL